MTILADGPVQRQSDSVGGEFEREIGTDVSAEPHRERYRTVYEEHCQALWDVDDPSVFFFALAQVMYGAYIHDIFLPSLLNRQQCL